MNKSFKTLFTLFLGILFFTLTFTANSEAKTEKRLIKINVCMSGSVKSLSLYGCPIAYKKIKDINQIEYQTNTIQNICYNSEDNFLSWNRDRCRTDLGEFKVKLDSATSNFYYGGTEETQIAKKEKKKPKSKKFSQEHS